MPDCDSLSDEELLYLVDQTDRALFDSGVDLRLRQWEIPQQLMKQFGYVGYIALGIHQPPIAQRIRTAFRSIYRAHDLAVGGHIGVFMYRDIFARIGLPRGYGTVQINPFEFVELTPVQLRIIQTEPAETAVFLDQFSDVADIHYGTDEIRREYASIELVPRYLGLARLHLHSAAALLTGGYDIRGAAQSALLAAELALKAGAGATGQSETDLRVLGHKTLKIANVVGAHFHSFDLARVSRALASHPEYVPNRYAGNQPQRREIGHLVMGTQYIVSEVVRLLSQRDFRSGLRPVHPRRYPI